MAIRQIAGANALDTANAVKTKLQEMSPYFPHGMKVVYPYDTTPFIKVAIREVVKTLLEAILLVFLIMWLFMGSLRATLIPTIAVPVVLLGTFGVLSLFGFSINMLTMFAMVLSIGLLVDDAIVVVENVERIMSEEGLSPREATANRWTRSRAPSSASASCSRPSSAPWLSSAGSTGVIYRQFSVTIIASMLLSVVVALILTPVLCATLLKPVPNRARAGRERRLVPPSVFPRLRPALFPAQGRLCEHGRTLLSRKFRYIAIYILIVAAVGFLFLRMPTSFVPEEDQGVLMAQVMLPTGSTLEQTEKVVERDPELFPGARERGGGIVHDHRRLRLLRAGTKQRAWSSSSSRTGSCATGRTSRQRPSRGGHDGLLPDAQRPGLRFSAAPRG